MDLPTPLKNAEELEIAKDIMLACQDSTAVCSVYYFRTGDRLTRQFVHRLKKTNDAMVTETQSDSTPASRLLESLNDEHECDYIAMFATGNEELMTETTIFGQHTTEDTSPAPLEVQRSIETIRKAMNIPSDGKMLMSVMWVRRSERDLFRARPHSLHIDFTANTDAEKMPLFLGVGLTAWNESVVVFRGITPNERLMWTDALISYGLPKLLGSSLMRSINVAVGDQCGQEITSWNKATHEGSNRGRYRLCGLHKIHFGLRDVHIVNRLADNIKGKKCVTDFIRWHEWFCKCCESKEEERFAKQYLDLALNCDPFVSCCGPSAVAEMREWSNNSFFPISHMLIHYHFMHLMGGRTWTNSIGEGQNWVHKRGSAGAKANYNIDTFFTCTSRRAERKEKERQHRDEAQPFKTPCYVTSEDARHLTPYAIETFVNIAKEMKNYYVWKRSPTEAWVCRKKWAKVTTTCIRLCRVRLQKLIYNAGNNITTYVLPQTDLIMLSPNIINYVLYENNHVYSAKT